MSCCKSALENAELYQVAEQHLSSKNEKEILKGIKILKKLAQQDHLQAKDRLNKINAKKGPISSEEILHNMQQEEDERISRLASINVIGF